MFIACKHAVFQENSNRSDINDELQKICAVVRKIRRSKGLMQLDLVFESIIGDISISHYELGRLSLNLILSQVLP
jgi:hypothetical protein